MFAALSLQHVPHTFLVVQIISVICFHKHTPDLMVFRTAKLSDEKFGMAAKAWSKACIICAFPVATLHTLDPIACQLPRPNPCQGRFQEVLLCQLEPDVWLHTRRIQEGFGYGCSLPCCAGFTDAKKPLTARRLAQNIVSCRKPLQVCLSPAELP